MQRRPLRIAWRVLALTACAGVVLLDGVAAVAGGGSSGARSAIDDTDRVVLANSVSRLAAPQADRGRSDLSLPVERLILSLKLREGAETRLEALLAAQHDPQSPLFHQWLTPEQFGAQFGLGDEDLATVTGWLKQHGFRVDEVAKGRGWVDFSGTVALVERAFGTEIDDFLVDGKIHHANATPQSIPRGLAALLNGVVTLHDFPRPAHHEGARRLGADYTSGSAHYLAPADFATIYDLGSVYGSGTTGSGRTVAITGRSDINLADVQYFRSLFGLPAHDPVIVHNGADPGDLGGGEETEADLDVQWSGAVAKDATVEFVVSKSTLGTDGIDLSAQYIIDNNLADSMSTSFGQCELLMLGSEQAFFRNTWAQAAAEGITAFVSSGDSGAAGCNPGSAPTGSFRAVSGICSTPYDVCVGGSEFDDTANPSLYWAAGNDQNGGSALSYVPEVAWNESANVSGGSGLWSSSGGASTLFSKPSWQKGLGVPNDGLRDVPDVSLAAAGHDGYLVVQGHTASSSGLESVGGTSAASPSFAGLMALVVQSAGARQGNANTVFYPMAASQYAGTGPAVFHDITSGNNSVPALTGFNCGPGYDEVTGLGTVDGAALIANWSGVSSDFSLTATPPTLAMAPGASGSTTVTVAITGGFGSSVSLSASGAPVGTTVSFNPTSIAAPGAGSSTVTISAGSTTANGIYTITLTGAGGGKTRSTAIALTVSSGCGAVSATSADASTAADGAALLIALGLVKRRSGRVHRLCR